MLVNYMELLSPTGRKRVPENKPQALEKKSTKNRQEIDFDCLNTKR